MGLGKDVNAHASGEHAVEDLKDAVQGATNGTSFHDWIGSFVSFREHHDQPNPGTRQQPS